MKLSTTILAALSASAFAFSPLALHAQDDQGGPPPPPMDQGASPSPDQQGGPPPPDGQGAPPDQGGDQGASFDEFYNNLSNDGQWIQTPDYGYAFQPAVQDPNWAPYTDGHWVYTAYGWTWASNEPWGWATYHYGRWVNIDGTGWCWIPGHQWAPAWVSWRYGGGYCGWAPLPPSTFVGVEFGGPGVNLDFDFHFGGDCDTAYGIGPGCYNFIQIGFIGDPYYRGHYVDRGRNFVIINNTRNITNININRAGRGTFGGVNAGGPNFAEVNRHSHTPVQQVQLAQAGRAGRSTLSGGTLSVFAPRINGGTTARQGRPANVSRSLSNVQINRGTSISQPLQVNSQLRGNTPSASAISAAHEAEAHAPKNVATSARVAPTVSAASVQQERTQSVQRQAAELHNAATTPNHTTGGGSEQRQFTGSPNAGTAGNAQTDHNAQVQHQQDLRQQQNQQQEHEAATQQQQQEREQALRQQQAQQQQHQAAAQQQQHEEALRQQQVQQQQHEAVQQQQQQVFHQQQQQVQEQHTSSQQQHESSPFTQQHSSAQPQEQHQSVAPQQQHSSQGGGNSGGGNGGNHSSGGGGGGNSGSNHSGGNSGGGGGGGNGGGNHSGGQGNNNNNNGQGH